MLLGQGGAGECLVQKWLLDTMLLGLAEWGHLWVLPDLVGFELQPPALLLLNSGKLRFLCYISQSLLRISAASNRNTASVFPAGSVWRFNKTLCFLFFSVWSWGRGLSESFCHIPIPCGPCCLRPTVPLFPCLVLRTVLIPTSYSPGWLPKDNSLNLLIHIPELVYLCKMYHCFACVHCFLTMWPGASKYFLCAYVSASLHGVNMRIGRQ